MSYPTFGVVASTLTRYVHRLTFSVSSSPTTDEAGELIADRAAELCGFLRSIGVDPDEIAAATASDSYRLAQSWVARAAAIDAERARGHHNTELAIAMADERDAILDRLRARTAEIGEGRPTGVNAANTTHTDVERATQMTTALETASLGRRLAHTGGI